jgi:hypothetical protein
MTDETKTADIVSLEEFIEQRRAKLKQASEAIGQLLGPPSKTTLKKIVIPYSPDDPDELPNFTRGCEDGFAKRAYRPGSTYGSGYGCGYLIGIWNREYSDPRKRLVWHLNYDRFREGIRGPGEVFGDEMETKPRGRPKLSSKRIRDICAHFDMMVLCGRDWTTGTIINEVAARYRMQDSERAVWDIFKEDIDFTGWFEPSFEHDRAEGWLETGFISS